MLINLIMFFSVFISAPNVVPPMTAEESESGQTEGKYWNLTKIVNTTNITMLKSTCYNQ